MKNVEDLYPLSPTQQGMLVHALRSPGEAVYVEQYVCLLRGDLDAGRFRAAWQRVVDRHPILRTAFLWEGLDEPLQVVRQTVEIPWTEEDWSGLPEEERAARLAALAAADLARGFDPVRAPLLRLTLLRLDDHLHRLIWTFHHLILEGWSLGLVLDEVAAAYEGRSSDEPRRPYRDFIEWLRRQDPAPADDFWRRELAGFVSPTPLGLPSGTGPAGHISGGQEELRLSAGLTESLQALARRSRVTLYTVVEAAWALLLSRYSGEEDVVFGVTVAGRPEDLPGSDRMVGLFINTVPVRAQASPERTLAGFLEEQGRRQRARRPHEHAPLTRIREASPVPRDRPLFESLLVFENAPRGGTLGTLEVLDVRLRERTNYPLTLLAFPDPEGLLLRALFDRPRLEPGSVRHLLGHLAVLLEGMASRPEGRLEELSPLTAAEREWLLADWRERPHPLREVSTLHGLVLAQAARTPQAVALIAGDRRWTYRELVSRAAAVARRLRDLGGVGPEVPVGVCVERSPEMVAGILGTLLAGGAYVPIDPKYPEERRTWMLEDSGARVLLDDLSGLGEAEPFASPAGPGSLAYIIYTSGSTGRPKGVAIEHRSAVALVGWAQTVFPPEDLAGVFASTSICFDLSIFELFVPLASGGTVILGRDALDLANLQGVTLVNTVPSAMAELVRMGAVPPSVRTVNLAGVPLRRSLVDRVLETGTVGRVLNLYGPSEDTTYSTWEEVGLDGEPTLGRPVTGTRAAVLGPDGSLPPAGVPGELVLGGAGLARGYWNRSDRTAERFVPDPFSEQPGERLYRTGDLVRRLPDGRLELLGRIDHQVKLRGFRIELGEVETALARLPGVREAVTAVRDDRLVAWVLGEDLSASTLRDALRSRLPEFMVPSAFVFLEDLPRTPTGKVDRRALPDPVQADPGKKTAPRTPTEELVAAVWSEILGRERVGRQDDFFLLGGHSLLAARVVHRLRETLRVRLPLQAVFSEPTLAGLARKIDEAAREDLPPIGKADRSEPLPASFAQERLWFLHQLQPGLTAYNLPVTVSLQGELDADALERALNEIVRRHEVLRTVYAAKDGRTVQIVLPDLSIPMPRIDLIGVPQETVLELAAREAARPFDLTAGPLVRALLVRFGEEEHALLLTLHHIVTDLWSYGVLLREIAALYGGTPLPDLPIQYADYAAWQRGWLRGEALDRLVEGWREILAGAPPAIELPTDRPHPEVPSGRGGRELIRIGGRLEPIRREGATLFMALLAAWSALLHRVTGQDDLTVGTPVAGRTRTELEDLIGFFVNTLVLRMDLSDDPAFGALVDRARDRALDAYALQDLPFEMLVEALRPPRDTGRNPLFQVMLTLQNAPLPELRIGDLALVPLEVETGTAQFDLALTLVEDGEGLGAALEYNADLFDPATAERLLGAFQTLARGADPDRKVGDLPLLSEAEREQLTAKHRAAAPARLLHRLIEAQAERTPDAEAVIFGKETLTYRELNRRADGLAHRLRTLGVGPETPVAVCLPASVDWVVSMLGILKAGGYYLPLDSTHPPQRRAQLLRLSGARVALTRNGLLEGLEVLDPEEHVPPSPGEGGGEAGEGGQGGEGSLAYAIYTSGSTGEPKAVGVSHAAAAEHSDVFGRALNLGPGDRVLQFFSWAFDASTEQVFPTLAHGAAVVLKTEEPWSPAEFTDRLAEPGITVLDLPAAFWHEWVQTGISPERTRLRHVIAGGAALPPESARLWTASGLPLWNGYGPTEAVVTALVFQVSPGWPGLSDAVRIPIGHNLAHRSSYVLDRGGEPLPPGLPGELCLGGTLARGYLGRPDLTAERFVPHPWSPTPGERLYRTGDLARQLPDGALEFLGRVDTQVKIRGFRIEIGEIETAVAALPGVRQAAVLVRGEGERQRLVAFLVPEGEPDLAAMRATLQERLPAYMVPASWVVLPEMPLNRSGKIDRKALALLADEERRASGVFAPPGTGVERKLAEIWREALGVETVGLDDSFFDLGGHSMLLSRVLGPTREVLGREVSLMDLFRYPTIRSLAALASGEPEPARLPVRRIRRRAEDGAIAIVGMACRLPGAPDVETFWSNLRNGVESITFFSDEELLRAGVDPRFLADPQYVRALGTLGDVSGFDARFFGYTPREAAMMDPQQRLFLEVAWEACEAAGIDPAQPRRSPGRIGVFAGQGAQDYLLQNIARSPLARDTGAAFQIGIGNEGSFLPTRVSYKLGLTGPSVHVQSACSTSLVAVHLACRSILAGECDAALAGGCTILLPTTAGYFSEDGGVQARDGHLRAFDADGTGFVPASGAGAVLLKPLAAALADGDRIHAVIRGSAINNDGAFKIGFTAPSVEGQAAVISEALDAAGVGPETIGYVEAHGTATPLGDPIEVEALTQAFRAGTVETGFCALGSVKTNIGHTDTAAGIAGLIKTVLMLEHGVRVPSLHLTKPNPAIDFESSPFYVGTRTEPWTGSPRRAGVSSFGLGGTNAHVILEEPPKQERETRAGRPWQLLTLSARTAKALDAATARLAAFLERHSETPLEDVALTLHTGRRRFEHRRVLVASSLTGTAEALGSLDPETVATAREERSSRPAVFLFPGGGAQHPNMGRGLYETEPVFRREMDRCAEIVLASEGWDLREPLAPERLRGTREGLPALFAVEIAMARLWMSWGVTPQAMIGHSLGEYAAACLAGVFTLEEAMALVVLRGKLFERLPAGGMLSVPRPESELGDLLGPDISFAAVNGPSQTVLSGTNEAMDAAAARLAERGLEHRRIHIDVAAHSHLVEPILAELEAFAAGLALRAPSIPFLSNVTGTWITPEEATSPAYWARHLRQTVRFGDGVRELLCEPDRVFLEVGPGHTLSTLVQQHPDRIGQAVVASMRHPQDPRPDAAFLLNALGRLWLAGADVDWDGFHAAQPGRRTPLPTYPFERQRCWIEPEVSTVAPAAGLVKRPDPAEWLYAPAWKPAPLPVSSTAPQRWLFLLDEQGLGEEVAGRLRQYGHAVTTARSLPETLDFERIADFRADFHSLFDLARVLARRREPASIVAVSTGIQRVTGEEELVPERAALLGPCRVIPQEYPHLACRSVDVDLPEGWKRARLVDQLAAELTADTSEPAVALRGGERWARAFEPITSAPVRLRERGVYLITGGLGSLGLQIAEHLARTVRARLVLTGRNARKSPAIQRIEALGATVEVRAADVADLEAMDGVLAWIDETWGELHGVFHAAGVAGAQGVALIQDRDSGEAHFRAKLQGAAVLERVLRGRPLDFCLLFSSLSSVLGGLGLAAYAGANAALDAFAQRHNQRFPVRWTSVAWETWQASGLPPQVAAFAVTPAEGLAVLDRLLGLGPVAQVLVSTGDLALRMRGTSPEPVEEEAVPEPPLDTQADRGDLTTAYAASRSDLERELAAVWSGLFGIARIGIHDGFFEMGGHSLLAVQLLNRLHRTYGVELPVRSLFENPTIARFAQVIAAATGREQAPEGPPLRDRIRAAAPGERRPLLVQWLREKLALAAGLQPGDVPEDGLPAGVDLERMVTDLILSLRRDFDVPFYPNEIVARPSVGELADYLAAELFQDIPVAPPQEAQARSLGFQPEDSGRTFAPPSPGLKPGATRLHPPPEGAPRTKGPKNPRMVFLLSAPRSGSTLTRVMLAGHPALFAPPELDLLQHPDMKSWAEEVHETPTRAMGLNRTLMELEGLTEEEARLRIHALVERNASVQEVFRLLQDQTGGRLLVDKSPGYALLSRTLQHAEELFEEPLYLYLYRHPAAMIESFLRNRLHRTYASAEAEPQEVAEHIWLRCNRNIRGFLAGVDPRRRFDLRYEELVSDPERVLRGVCDFLGIPFDAGVLDPYGGGRMIDGSGDPNITDRNRVDPRLGEAWKKVRLPRELDPEVRRVAMELGYEVDQPIRKAPLSFQQQRLWFLARLHPDSSAYNLPLHVRLTGPLRVPALASALGEVARRHEILRTVFSLDGGEPVQSVLAPRPARLPLIDLSGLPDPDGELKRLARAEAERPFDLAAGPLLRSSLVRLGREEHALLLVLHHIVTDGWSNALLLAEIAALYQGKTLPELPLQYADYAAAQRERLQGERLETLLAWWRERLAGAPTALDLPTDRPRPRIATARGGAREVPLPETLPDRLQAVSQRHRASLFMTLLASFAALLHRVSGQDDLLIGTPIADRADRAERNRQEMEGMIGFLVNSLVIRVDLSGDPGFGELLDRVRETALGAYAHQELPFERLVEELQPERDLSRNPLYQAGFALNHERPGRVELPGLTLSTLETAIDNIKFDLSLAAQESRTGPWHFFWQWSSDLFDPSTVMRLHRQAVTLLEAALADPGRPLSDLPLADRSERRQILAPAARFRVTATLHRLFEAQAARAPEATAVVFENERLTYGELDARADRWASHLQELGVGPEVRVGLRAERSLGLVVGLLAILKAGGAYVPLDPAYPEERLRFLIEDSGVRVVLTQDDLDGEIPASGPASGIEPDPDNLAYVIYTSGSTGRPKGVGVTHANVVRLFLSSKRLFGFGPRDTWTLFHSHAFDFSVWEIWGALLHGGTLVVVPYGVSRSPSAFRELLARARVTVLNQTPSAFRQLVEADARADGGLALRHVVFGGEALDLPSLAPWFERHGDETPRLVNMYGITETTVHVTWRPVGKADLQRGSVIGSPLPDLSIALLDRRLEPVPEGVPGEMYVGGAGLARGYLGRPELTAERFVPDPWSPEPGARLYRSGDLARALPGGDLEYRGRIDHQVKIRGFRVEPGEIERVLAQHPSVRQAAVLARVEEGDLVAYVVLHQEDSTLRSYLKERLPDYMVPSFFVRLDAMPLTSNNKLDLRALARLRPEPERRRLAEPADELEAVIAGVWKEVLGIAEAGVEDNFFDLGGHSMRMVKIEGRLREVLGREVPLVDLFRYPTIRSLARHLSSSASPSLQPLQSLQSFSSPPSGAVAIVGMAGRFPGAPDLAAFWENLRAGVESVVRLSEADLEAEGIALERFRRPEYVPAHGVLQDVELFDAPFFGIPPREAELMDPQHRFFLECAWEALEDAGLTATDRVGVFAGSSSSSYLLRNLASHPDLLESVGAFQLGLHGERDFLATRVSYKLGLTGPSMTIQTSCSTSLVAVHVACRSLLTGECDAALAGGVSIGVPQRSGYVYQEGGILSPEGRCRAFDAAARGTVGGSGAGVVVLKRLEDALAAGDPIHAVIRGSAVNNDGSLKAGFTAPSVGGQARVIAEALAMAGFDPAGIGMVEAHGTGTELGDPIEVAALAEAFGPVGPGRVAIGSVKTNIGHLDAAAGVAGLIKAVLAVENGEIPPSLHFEEPNPRLGLDRTPFFVNTELREWPAPRRAGVSSFGMGGTNVHLVLEQAPEPAATTEPARPDQLLVLSARTPAALDRAAERLAEHLRSHPGQDLADIAYTLQTARRAFPHRRAFVIRDREDGLMAIDGRATSSPRKVAFLLSGQGSQHAGMAHGLYDSEPAFREAFDRCQEILGLDLLGASDDELRQTDLTQPTLFAVEYALARLWMDWGVRPQALIGHSVGELVAACLAGVFSLQDALALVAARGRLMAELPPGAMLAVLAPAAEVEPRLGPELSLAAVNSPAHCVVSGPSEAVANFAAELECDGIETRPLHTSHAFHSPMMQPAVEPFERLVAGVRREEPRIPFLSNVTGTWITPEEATDPAYWARQLLQLVRFADGLATLLAEGELALLEVGPGRALATFARQHPSRPLAIPSLPHPRDGQDDMPFLLGALGRLWTAGVEVDWQAFHRQERRRRVRLPTYPFEQHRYWIEASHVSRPAPEQAPPAPELHERPGNLPSAYEPPATEIERGLCKAWQTVLGIGEIGIRDNFFDLGGDSLLAPRVLQEIRGIFGVELPLRFLFDTPTIAELAAPVEALLQEQEVVMVVPVDFPSEAVLDPSVLPEGRGPDPDRIAQPREVVLTGSTGFLGAYLLGELLRRTDARIHCLVRAQDAKEGLDRIRRRMTAAGLWSPGAEARVVAVPGDLEQERWGLSEEDFTRLAGLADAIYHCGAWVNFTYPYAALKAANVGSTREALRLAGHVRTKPLHLVSSTAAVSALGVTQTTGSTNPVVWEDEEYPTYRGLFTGYGSTKWVAEQHVLEARRRGIPVNIYRPGTLAGDSRTGFGNPRDMIWNMMKSCIQIGAVPEDPQRATSLDVTPVNYVAAAIVHLSLQPERIGGTFHFPNPRPLPWDEVYDFARAYGYTIQTVPFEEWDARLAAALGAGAGDAENALAPFAPLIAWGRAGARSASGPPTQIPREPRFDDRRTRAGLEGSGIVCPPLGEDLLRTLFDWLVGTGFLPKPASLILC
jgi:amino acid adenylation domain-containing protein/thioester reductase-like protein